MLKKILIGALVALALPLTVAAGPAAADVAITPISDCSSASVRHGILDLQTAVATLTISGQNAEKDRATLQGKLSDAVIKIDNGKPLDAAAKLSDFRLKIIQLQNAGKISTADAASLVAAVDPIILCLGGTL